MKYKLLTLVLFVTTSCFAQTDTKLTDKLQDAIKGFNGQVGIYVQNLKTGKTVAINADTLFPTASMIKVSIQCGLMDKIEKGEMQYNQKLVYRDSLLYKGEDILGSFKDKDTIEVSKVALLMITMSDNTASVWLQKLIGTDYINDWLEANGFKVMRDNSRATGREAMHEKYGWGVTTPYEMCRLFTMIRNGEAVSLRGQRTHVPEYGPDILGRQSHIANTALHTNSLKTRRIGRIKIRNSFSKRATWRLCVFNYHQSQ